MKKLKRDQIISDLIDYELEHFTTSYQCDILYSGLKGFKDYMDAELIQEYEYAFDEKVQIVA